MTRKREDRWTIFGATWLFKRGSTVSSLAPPPPPVPLGCAREGFIVDDDYCRMMGSAHSCSESLVGNPIGPFISCRFTLVQFCSRWYAASSRVRMQHR